MKEKFSLSPLVLSIAACLMTACGGGGGGDSSTASAEPASDPAQSSGSPSESSSESGSGSGGTPAAATVSMQVQVIDGYLSGADVCIVKENDPKLSCDESFGTVKTDDNGKATFRIPEDRLRNFTSLKFKAVAAKGTGNITRGTLVAIGQDVMLLGTKYLSDDSVNNDNNGIGEDIALRITPFTTLVEKHLRTGASQPDENAYNAALDNVAQQLGLSADVITSDYNADGTDSEDANKALAAGELIVASNLLPNSSDAYSEDMEDEQKDANLKEQLADVKANVEKVIDQASKDSSSDKTADKKLSDAINNRKDTLRNSFVSLSSGPADEWRCGATEANEVWCWGNNAWGNLGNPEFSAKAEAAGKYSPDDGDKTTDKLLGNWTADPVHVLIKNPNYGNAGAPEYIPLTGVTKVAAGNTFGCALTVDHEVWCWGGNSFGQLGWGSGNYKKENETVPYAVKVVSGTQDSKSGYLGKVTDLSTGQNHVCALTSDGEIYCWGDNTAMELGDDFADIQVPSLNTKWVTYGDDDISDKVRVVPYPVKVPAEGAEFIAMTKGGYWAHCAITDPEADEYNLWCWGDDTRGLVSGNNRQYHDEIEKNWQDKVRVKNGNREVEYAADESYNWHYHTAAGDLWPMFAKPVTNVKKYTDDVNNKEVEMKKLSSIDILAWDSNLIYSSLTDQKSTVKAMYTDNNININYQQSDAHAWELLESSSLNGGDKVREIITEFEEPQIYIITEKGRLLEFGENRYGMLGTGEETTASQNPGDDPAVPTVFKDERYQIKGLSLNKRSVCAMVTDSQAEDPAAQDLWCWGSSTFGQLGFDNGDNNFSYADTALEWDGSSNEYFDASNRMEKEPKKITLDYGD